MATKTRHDWSKLDPVIDQLKAQGWNDSQIARDLGIGRQTLVDHLRSRGAFGTPTEHLGTPEHQGTLEGYQEVMEDVQQSVPEIPHISTEEPYQSTPEHQSVPQQPDSPEVHPSTPEVHQNMSVENSGVLKEHSGVPARQDHLISTPMVHPGTPTTEDWELWTTIKERWEEVEKMLAERQAFRSIPTGTPEHTQKKTYVFHSRHIALIEAYAQEHHLDLKDVIYTMCEEFFQRR